MAFSKEVINLIMTPSETLHLPGYWVDFSNSQTFISPDQVYQCPDCGEYNTVEAWGDPEDKYDDNAMVEIIQNSTIVADTIDQVLDAIKHSNYLSKECPDCAHDIDIESLKEETMYWSDTGDDWNENPHDALLSGASDCNTKEDQEKWSEAWCNCFDGVPRHDGYPSDAPLAGAIFRCRCNDLCPMYSCLICHFDFNGEERALDHHLRFHQDFWAWLREDQAAKKAESFELKASAGTHTGMTMKQQSDYIQRALAVEDMADVVLADATPGCETEALGMCCRVHRFHATPHKVCWEGR